jgi:hypothetical protein
MTRVGHAWLTFVGGACLALACSSSTARDKNFNSDAESGFEPPPPSPDAAGAAGSGGSDGAAGAGGQGGSSGATAGAAGSTTDADTTSDGGAG